MRTTKSNEQDVKFRKMIEKKVGGRGNDPPPALCSTLVIRPRLNSAKGYFYPKSGLSYVFVYDLMIYDHFLSTL